MRRKYLSVFDFFFRLRKLSVIVEISHMKTVQAAVTGVGVVDIFSRDASGFGLIAGDEMDYLFIQLFASLFRDALSQMWKRSSDRP